MTVEELINRLKELPPHYPVYVQFDRRDPGYYRAVETALIAIKYDRNEESGEIHETSTVHIIPI